MYKKWSTHAVTGPEQGVTTWLELLLKGGLSPSLLGAAVTAGAEENSSDALTKHLLSRLCLTSVQVLYTFKDLAVITSW